MARLAVLSLGLFLLAGCGAGTPLSPPISGTPLLGAVELVTIVNTDKTVSDHVFSFTTGKDCSTIRSQKGGEYCMQRVKPVTPEVKPLFCYRSLAGVDCYPTPLQGANDRLVGYVTPPMGQ